MKEWKLITLLRTNPLCRCFIITPSCTRRWRGIFQGKKKCFPQNSDYVRDKMPRNKGKETVQQPKGKALWHIPDMKCPQIPVLSRVQTRTFSLFWVSSLFPWPLVPWACSLSSPPLLPPFHKQLYRAFVSSALVQWNTNTIWQGSGAFLLGLLYKHPFGMQSRAWAKLSSGVFFSAKCTYMGPYLGAYKS